MSSRAAPGAAAGRPLLGLLLLAGSGDTYAATGAEAPAPKVRVLRSWTTDDGLPQNSIQAIGQTSDGYLWIGTQEGLVRFDGVRFRRLPGPPGVRAYSVRSLHVGRDGRLWVGASGGGLFRLEEGALRPVPPFSDSVRALHESEDGTLWVGTPDGVARLAPGAREPVFALPGRSIYALHEDAAGSLWAGTDEGLHAYRDGRWERLGADVGLPPGSVSALAGSRDGALWIGTGSAGLFRLAGGRARACGLGRERVGGVVEDRDGVVWLATDHGVKRLEGGRLMSFDGGRGSLGRIFTLFEDREGNLWVGTHYDGLIRLSTGSVGSHGGRGGVYPPALSVYQDSRGDVWFGTAGAGLGRLSGDQTRFYTRRDGVADDIVGPLEESRNGELWLGLRSRPALQLFRDGRPAGLVRLPASAASLHQDAHGALWIGTIGAGLLRWAEGRLTRWTTDDGLPSGEIRAVVADGEGGLWLGTRRGLARFDGRSFTVYGPAQGLPSERVVALYQEAEGPLWVGTSGGGLARLARGRIAAYGTAQGLCDDRVFSILDDGLGHLWMSSNQGIFRVAKSDLAEVAAGARARVSCVSYGKADGMASAECNGGYQHSGWRTRDGRLWFASVQGLAVVAPEGPRRANPLRPPVWIEEVRADDRALSTTSPGRLPPGTKRLEITYTAPTLVASERARFRHRLWGFDRGWVEAQDRRQVSYTSLPAGRYVFQVVACNSDGLWNDEGARWELDVEPLFHQTGWFRLAGLLSLGAGAWSVHRLRVRGFRLRNAVLAERTRISEEIHDRVSQIMTGVILQLDGASQTLAAGPTRCRPYLERAAGLAREGIEQTRGILRGLGKAEVDGRHWAGGLLHSVTPLLEGSEVRLHVRETGRPQVLPPEIQQELSDIAREGITNALRHGQAGRIEVSLQHEAHGVRLAVLDDGRGLARDAEEGGPGLGLVGLRRRVGSRGGSVEIRSGPRGGTTLEVFVPRGGWRA